MDASLPSHGAPRRRAEDANVKVSSPLIKFGIGFVAGLCAAVFPRLTAQLLSAGNDLAYLSLTYLACSAVFAAMIGAVVAIMEWHVAKEPRLTFMAALGIPAIITGSFNTIDSSRALDDKVKENSALVHELQNTQEIKVWKPKSVEPLSTLDDNPHHAANTWWLDGLIAPAQAGDNAAVQQWRQTSPSLYQTQARYVVVLDQRPTREEAIARAAEISKDIPAQAIMSEKGFLIIKRATPTEQATALLDALRIRESTSYRAEILELP